MRIIPEYQQYFPVNMTVWITFMTFWIFYQGLLLFFRSFSHTNLPFFFTRTHQNFNMTLRETSENVYLFVFISWLVSFGVCIYVQYFFDVVRNKLQTINIYSRVDKKKIKSSGKEYDVRTGFKFWPMKNIFRKP